MFHLLELFSKPEGLAGAADAWFNSPDTLMTLDRADPGVGTGTATRAGRSADVLRFNQSAGRALMILNLLGDAKADLGVREIARQTSLATSIVQRLVNTLTDFGYLEQLPESQKYRVGYRAFQIGHAYLGRNDLGEAAQPEMRVLASMHQLNVYLGVLRDQAAIYLAVLQSSSPIVIKTSPGSRAYLHSTAMGKALLMDKSDEEIRALLGPAPYERLTVRTKTRPAQLLADIRQARLRGYAIADQENLVSVLSIAAPIRDLHGQVVASISGAMPGGHLKPAQITRLCKAIKDAAERISRRLGAPPSPPSGRR